MATILKKTNKQPLGFAQSTQPTANRTLKPFQGSLLTLLFAMTLIPLFGNIYSEKVLAQTLSSCPAGTTPRTLEWTPSNFAGIANQTPSVDGITASFSFTESLPGQVIDQTETLISNVIYGGIPGPNLEFNIGISVNQNTQNNLPAPLGSNATLIINFNQPVTLAPLTLLDVDRNTVTSPSDVTFQDRVTVTAFNGSSPVGVTLAALGNPPFTRVTGNVALGIVANSPRDQNNANVSATLSGPVTQIRILYEPGTEFGQPQQDETIGLARINICTALPGTIGDTVYSDTNGNSVQDANEPGISGVNLNLTGAGPDGQFGTPDDIIRPPVTTDSNGRYSFTQLPAGNYRVVVTNPPAGFTATQRPPETINLTAGQNLDTVDFGFTQQQLGTIGDTVYNDTNGNRTQDGNEPGISGRIVNLTGSNNINRTTTTDNNGKYSFPNLPSGDYRVVITNPPEDFSPTQIPPETINLASGQNLDTVDFGFRIPPVGSAQTNLRLVKRITNVLRNGQPISGLNFNTFDDGTGEDDNTINQSQPVRGFREIETSLQSGDEVEYTLYYLAEGSQDLQNVRFCDLIPSQTSYSADSFGGGRGIVVNRTGTNNTLTNAEDSDQGAFFSPLRPLPSGNTCQNQTNNQGAVILNLGNISPSSNFGFIRFRVRID